MIFLITACAPAEDSGPSFIKAAKNAVVDVCKDALAVITAPLEDLNIKRQPIPDELHDCAMNPYAMPLPPLCSNIQAELVKLDEVLGPDMEPSPLPWLLQPKTKKDYLKQGIKEGANLAQEQAVGMVGSKANVIPFRGVVRKVTGAEKHSKEVARAYEAGKLRRAFLKGLRAASDCTAPTLEEFPGME